jgi:tetratricopeptide (TPR) repeat protein
VLVLVLGGVVLTAALGGYVYRRLHTPLPPEISLEGVDPALAQRIEEERQKVHAEPHSAAAWGQLGKFLLASHFDEQAAACFVQAERCDPGEPRWPYLRANALLLHDPDAALIPLRRAVELCDRKEPTNTAVRLRLVETLLTQGSLKEAEDQLHLVLDVEPDNPRAHWNYGVLAYHREDLIESRSHLERCLNSPLTRKKAFTQLAAIAQRFNETREATAYNAQAAAAPTDLSWDDPFVREYQRQTQVGIARFRAVESLEAAGRHQEACRVLRELAQESPDYRVYIGLGKNLLLLGDYAEAETALRTAVQMAPEKAQAYYYLSKGFWLQAEQQRQRGGDRKKSEELLRRAADFARQAIARKTDHALAHLYLGLALRSLGQRIKGLDALREAVQYSPDAVDLYLQLAEAQIEDGNKTEARATLERALRVARPEDARPRTALAKLNGQGKKAE